MAVAQGGYADAPIIRVSTTTPEVQVATSTPETKKVPVKIQTKTATNTNETSAPKEYLYLKGGIYASVLDRVISCESGWNVMAKNANSSASGLAQFISSTWISTRLRMGLDPDLNLRFDYKEMIDTTIFLWDEGRGAGHWTESRYCWYRGT